MSGHLTHETEKQQASGKHHYDDSEIKANFDFRATQLARKEEMRLRYGQELSERETDSAYEVLYKGMTIRQVIEQNPIVPIKNDSEKL